MNPIVPRVARTNPAWDQSGLAIWDTVNPKQKVIPTWFRNVLFSQRMFVFWNFGFWDWIVAYYVYLLNHIELDIIKSETVQSISTWSCVFFCFPAPPIVGALRDLTGTYTSGMYFCCAALVPVSLAAVWELIITKSDVWPVQRFERNNSENTINGVKLDTDDESGYKHL